MLMPMKLPANQILHEIYFLIFIPRKFLVTAVDALIWSLRINSDQEISNLKGGSREHYKDKHKEFHSFRISSKWFPLRFYVERKKKQKNSIPNVKISKD